MALFRVVVRKAWRSATEAFKWSNVYYTDAPDVATAAGRGLGYWNRERIFHDTTTFLYEVYASDLVPLTQNFTTLPAVDGQEFGQYLDATELYHPSIVLRVDFLVPSSRPSRKFYRIPFREGTVVNGVGTLAAFTAAATDGLDQLLALGAQAPVDESGNGFTGYVIRGLTTRRLGREAHEGVPAAPVP